MEFNGIITMLAKLFEESLNNYDKVQSDFLTHEEIDDYLNKINDDIEKAYNLHKILSLEEDRKILSKWKLQLGEYNANK